MRFLHKPNHNHTTIVTASPQRDSMTIRVKENIDRQRKYLRDVERVLAESK